VWRTLSSIERSGRAFRCSLDDGTQIEVSAALGSRLRPNTGLALIAPKHGVDGVGMLVVQPVHQQKASHLLFTSISHVVSGRNVSQDGLAQASLPNSDSLQELYIAVEAIRSYFFGFEDLDGLTETLYQVLHVDETATIEELRVAWRLRRTELAIGESTVSQKRRAERAFNILALPELRSGYDQLRKHLEAVPLFPFGGVGTILLEGQFIASDRVFIGRRILDFSPDMSEQKLSLLLRCGDFFADRIEIRDGRRRVEVFLDTQLSVDVKADHSWNVWKNWIRSRLEIEATFVTSAKERFEKGERIINKWSVALPSLLRVAVPEGLMADIVCARAFHALLGRHADLIRQIAAQIESQPAEHSLVEEWFRDFNAERELRPQHVNWQPDFDEFYFEELRKRSKTWFLFRDEYLFVWHTILIAEIPALGHATYLFSRPQSLEEFLAQYAKTERDEVRRNRDEVASRLGFIGRVVRGRRKMRWLNDVLARAGGQVERGNTPDWPGASC
jgi:hypothetical protein